MNHGLRQVGIIFSLGFLFICTRDEFACLREVDVKFVCMVAVDSQGQD